MTDSPNPREAHEQELIGTLLDSLYENHSDQAQQLVTAGLQNIKIEPGVVKTPFQAKSWMLLSLAASLVAMVVVVFNLGPAKSATAAVSLTIEESIADVGRRYSLVMELQINGIEAERERDLYIKGDQFAVRTKLPPLQVRELWVGGNEQMDWVVPPIGPVIQGQPGRLISWVPRDDSVATPFLHLKTVLKRLQEHYELEFVEAETIETAKGPVYCKKIVGVLRGTGDEQRPDRFELWAAAESHVAMKLVGHWDESSGIARREKITIQWQEEIQLDNDFFGPDAHGGFGRPRISFGVEN